MQFTIVVVPCLAGSQYGYVGRYKKYQFWGRTRMEVINDFLKLIFTKN